VSTLVAPLSFTAALGENPEVLEKIFECPLISFGFDLKMEAWKG
jgi:hypothetical protein